MNRISSTVTEMILGLTGGIGCGKTTAGEMFAGLGFGFLDADAIVRGIILKNQEVIDAIRSRFGAEVMTASGEVDRQQLAQRVFPDEAKLRWLEGLLHPRLFEYWRQAFAAEPGQILGGGGTAALRKKPPKLV